MSTVDSFRGVISLPCTDTEFELKVVIKGISLACSWFLLVKIFINKLMCSIVMSLPLSRHPISLKFLKYVAIYILRSDSFLTLGCNCCLLGGNWPIGFPLTGLTIVLWVLDMATLLILTEYAVADILPYSAISWAAHLGSPRILQCRSEHWSWSGSGKYLEM